MPLRSFVVFAAFAVTAATWDGRKDGLLPIELRQVEEGERIFIDSAGRQRFFHGTNAIVKGPPWVPAIDVFSQDISLVDEDFQHMQEVGVTLLRLGTMWPGVEPTRGAYDLDYLGKLRHIAKGAAKRGIYTLLDGHQDAFSERFCGEGMPDWARSGDGPHLLGAFPAPWGQPITDLYVENKSNGALFPTRQACSTKRGPQFQAAKEPAAAYEALYQNRQSLGDAWASMWAKVAEFFLGDDNILGLELLNEPFAGDFYHNPLIMVPFPNPINADRSRLQPAYDRINNAVRKVDDRRLIFFAGMTWDDAGPGFSAPPGGSHFANRSVLAFHYYQGPQVDTRLQLKAQLAGARRLGTGLLLTESGGGNKGGDLWDTADDHLTSWIHWSETGGSKPFCRESKESRASKSQMSEFGACRFFAGSEDNCCRNHTASYAPARTYATAVAGRAKRMHFDTVTGGFQLEFYMEPSIMLPTEIRVSPQTYPRGFTMSVTPVGAAKALYNPKENPYVVSVVSLLGAQVAGLYVNVTLVGNTDVVV